MEKAVLRFLNDLEKNNNREWFKEHKDDFDLAKGQADHLFAKVYEGLGKSDVLEPLKIFRIYRDVRFSKDKAPYKNHFSVYIGRLKPDYRGGYYLHIEPGKSFLGLGFWEPNKEDLYRIRKEIELDDELELILNSEEIKSTFGALFGDELKTAPKGFDKDQERIGLIRKKQFLLKHDFSDAEVLHADFSNRVVELFLTGKPFMDYMTDVLLTNLNGERL